MKFATRTALSAVATLLAHPFRALASKPGYSLEAPTLGKIAEAGGIVVPRALATATIRADVNLSLIHISEPTRH